MLNIRIIYNNIEETKVDKIIIIDKEDKKGVIIDVQVSKLLEILEVSEASKIEIIDKINSLNLVKIIDILRDNNIYFNNVIDI